MILFHATDRNRRQTSKLQFAFCAAQSEQQEETANCCAVAVCVPCHEVLRTHFQLSYSLVVELLGHASVALIPCTHYIIIGRQLQTDKRASCRGVYCYSATQGSEEPATHPGIVLEESELFRVLSQCRNQRHSKYVSGG